MTRLEWFKENISYSKMLRHTRMWDFDEFVIERWGDVCVFRVYGRNQSDYQMTER